ncbi:hypothetical protein B4135_4063 [Caldibacillus debilis]|uniref:Uncharacterized protein n=1 Tax=Caldibacillus debilis TaxID=301148 RepID=A0A150L9H4_9BACI|nr:hypothetical protein B4135_4063 [Caldibacillus debilis]
MKKIAAKTESHASKNPGGIFLHSTGEKPGSFIKDFDGGFGQFFG